MEISLLTSPGAGRYRRACEESHPYHPQLVAKARRLMPLLPNLRVWLEPIRKTEGPVCLVPNLHFRLNYLGDKAGVGWRQNALRHSYASYRLADMPDAAKVALEMGNSPEKLFRHYRELVTPDAAKEWFAIMPSPVLT